jgi:SAM-dependent methyltransferase
MADFQGSTFNMSESIDRDTDHDWARIAQDNPYWGVLSVDAYRGVELSDDARAAFFRSGETLIGNVWAFIRKYVKEDFDPARSLDFGCGVGRLLIPIAQRSGEAVGVDVAPNMLELSRTNLAVAGVSNATLAPPQDGLKAIAGPFDFVNSYIVIQHIPPSRGYELLHRLLRLVALGGVASLQLTYGKSRRFFMHEAARASHYRREGRTLVDLAPAFDDEPPTGSITMYDYDLNQIFAMITAVSGSPILTLPTNDDDHLGVHMIFVRAR